MNTEQIGSFVLLERKKQGLSQKTLAEKAGLSRYQQILEIEKSQFDYGIGVLIKVLNALNVTFVLNGTGQSVPESNEKIIIEQKTGSGKTLIFDFSIAKAATEENNPDQPVEKKKQPKKTPTATFKKKDSSRNVNTIKK